MGRYIFIAGLAVLGLASATQQARGGSYSSGAGVIFGTTIFPTNYPLMFPPAVSDYGSISKVKGDFMMGGEGYYQTSSTTRYGVAGTLGFGRYYFDANLIAKYHVVKDQGSGVQLLTGGGLGIGRQRFRGYAEEKLVLPYFPLRVEAGLIYGSGEISAQVTAFAQYNLPSAHNYTNFGGDEEDVGVGIYPQIGLTLGVFYGKVPESTTKTKKGGKKKGKSEKDSGKKSKKGGKSSGSDK